MKKLAALLLALTMILASGCAPAETAPESPEGTWYVYTVVCGDLSYDVSRSTDICVFELNADGTGSVRKAPESEPQGVLWREDPDGGYLLEITDAEGNPSVMKMAFGENGPVLSDENKTFILGGTAPEDAGLRCGLAAEYACAVAEDGSRETDELIEGAAAVIRSRLESMGITATVERLGGDRIRVAIPDRYDESVLDVVSARGKLEFINPAGEVFMTGEMVQSASYFYNEGDHQIAFVLTEEGAELFAEQTAASIGKKISIYLDGELLIEPTVQSQITGGAGVINGLGTVQRAMEIAAKIQAPPLPVSLALVDSAVVYDVDTALAAADALRAEREAAAAVVLKLGDRVYTKADVEKEVEGYISYLESVYAMYGYPFDPADPMIISYARETVIRSLKEGLAQDAKAVELGLDLLTEEELAEVNDTARGSYEEALAYVKQYMIEDTAGMDEEAVNRAAEEKMAELGYPLERYVEEAKHKKVMAKLRDYALKDTAVAEEEIRAEYESRVAADKATYEGNAGAWARAVLNGKTLYYTPSGVRRVKQILVKFRAEDLAAINEAKNQGDGQALAEAQEKAFAGIDGQADEVLAALDAEGADWEALMAQYNEDPGMTTYPKGYPVAADMPGFDPAFVEAAMALEHAGDHTGKVRGTSYGYYIIRYDSDEPEGPADYDSVKESIAAELLASKTEEAYNAAVETWISEAGIEEHMDALNWQ